MLIVENKTKIFIACPYNSISGGAETLHQLVDRLNSYGLNAYIYYFDKRDIKEVHSKFKNYNIKFTTSIEDDVNNILIITESFTELLYKYKKIRKCIWWLSVDFYYSSFTDKQFEKMMIERKLPKKFSLIFKVAFYIYTIFFTKKYRKFKFDKDKYKNEYIHFYNCEYARQFLLQNGIKEDNIFYLCGPIRKEFMECNNINLKENIVVYNPAKGLEYTKKIIETMKKKDKNIRFIPIQNMSPNEIMNLLEKSKVYIDFGFFPGPERIPREAVASGCNIITSNIGSASNDIDVPIPNSFKFSIKDENKDSICDLIIDMIYNFEKYKEYYDLYREKVSRQHILFEENIKKIFNLVK